MNEDLRKAITTVQELRTAQYEKGHFTDALSFAVKVLMSYDEDEVFTQAAAIELVTMFFN